MNDQAIFVPMLAMLALTALVYVVPGTSWCVECLDLLVIQENLRLILVMGTGLNCVIKTF